MKTKNSLYSISVCGRKFKTKFKVGDRVAAPCYVYPLIIASIDEFATNLCGKLCWDTTDEGYLLGKVKTDNGDSYPESELYHI